MESSGDLERTFGVTMRGEMLFYVIETFHAQCSPNAGANVIGTTKVDAVM